MAPAKGARILCLKNYEDQPQKISKGCKTALDSFPVVPKSHKVNIDILSFTFKIFFLPVCVYLSMLLKGWLFILVLVSIIYIVIIKKISCKSILEIPLTCLIFHTTDKSRNADARINTSRYRSQPPTFTYRLRDKTMYYYKTCLCYSEHGLQGHAQGAFLENSMGLSATPIPV